MTGSSTSSAFPFGFAGILPDITMKIVITTMGV